jgi:thioredoxin-like negative regulator of GroEL
MPQTPPAKPGGKPIAPAAPDPKTSDKDAFKYGMALRDAGQLEGASVFLDFANKKKSKPQYKAALDEVNAGIANHRAEQGQKALAAFDFRSCETAIGQAKKYAATDKVQQLESDFARVIGEIRNKYEAAVKQANDGDPEGALPAVRELLRHDYVVPNAKAEITRMTRLWVDKLLAEGREKLGEGKWEESSIRFQRALEVQPDNAAAKEGVDAAGRGQRASIAAAESKRRLEAGDYSDARRLVSQAIATYPETAADFEPLRRKITEDWIQALLTQAEPLLAQREDFLRMRDGYLRVRQVFELDPKNAKAPELLKEYRQDFAYNSEQLASRLTETQGGWGFGGTSTLLMLNARALGNEETVNPAKLKEVSENLKRKVTSHVVIQVNNLSEGGEQAFINTLQERTTYITQRLGMPDIRIHSKGECDPESSRDPLIQDLLPDGKTPWVWVTVALKEWVNDRRAGPTTEVQSEYVCGKESKPNPDYLKARDEVRKLAPFFEDPKNGGKAKNPEGVKRVEYIAKKDDLTRMKPELEVDKVCAYTVQKRRYTQATRMGVSIDVKDGLSNTSLSEHEILVAPPPTEGDEIKGCEKTDTKGMKCRDQELVPLEDEKKDIERRVLAELDKILPVLIKPSTDRFLKEAERLKAAGRDDDAAESYICHWAMNRGRTLDPEIEERITEAVKLRTGFDLKSQKDPLIRQLDATPLPEAAIQCVKK